MKFKDGVKAGPLFLNSSAMIHALCEAERTAPLYYTPTVTSVEDGIHKAGSLHYLGRAFDLRIKDLPVSTAELWTDKLRKAIGSSYDVVLEIDKSCMHVEYQPK